MFLCSPGGLQLLDCKRHQDDKLPVLVLYFSLCRRSLVAK